MTDTSPTDTPIRSKIADESSIETVEIGQHCGGHLLAGLQDSASEPKNTAERFENELAVVHLAMAASLFLH